MSSAAPPASLYEKIDAYRVVGQTMLVALTQFLTTPMRSGPRPKELFKDVMYKALRFQLSHLSLSQEKYLLLSSESNYLATAKQEAFHPESLTLESGCKAFWFGSKSADKVIVYFHGGGYVMPCSLAHYSWVSGLNRTLSASFSVSTLILGYTCSPEAHYPTQLTQAVELLHHLLVVEGRKPSDLILAGDSAGGNLTLALLSHILHPHPSIATKLSVSEPFRAVVLISPWIDFNMNRSAYDRNVQTDMIPEEAGGRWSQAFMGAAQPDNYNQPILADGDWFSGLSSLVNDVLVWGGGGEVMIDSIETMAKRLKAAVPGTDTIIQPGACHEEFIIEKIIGYTRKAQGTELIEQWISSKL